MKIDIDNTQFDVKPCDSCDGMRVLSGGVVVGHIQRSRVFHRHGHGVEVSELCALGQRVYGGTIVRPSLPDAQMAAVRRIAGWAGPRG